MSSTTPRRRRAFATFLVLWAVALASIVLTSLQAVSHKQAAGGRLAVARVRAWWAARGAIEAQIAVLTTDTLSPDTTSAFRVRDDLANAARGSLYQASFAVRHAEGSVFRDGAMDAHSKLNINTMSKESLLSLRDIDEATVDAIIDWIDDDDEPEENGAEAGQYTSQKFPYKPRNAPMRSLRELELVIGVRAETVRGEDWNLNGLLDPNEDDGDLSYPPDNGDGRLDAGWSEFITVVSDDGVGPGYGPSGQPRLDLSTATSDDVATRVKIDKSQADVVVQHAAAGGSMADFLETDLRSMATGGATQLNGQQQTSVVNLTTDQVGTLLDEAYLPTDSAGPRSGKVNINTVDQLALEYLTELDPTIADALITERNARSGGFVHLVDLLTVPSVSREVLAGLYPYLDVRSQVYVATARGRDEPSGLEVEIQAVLDRSTVPVVIKDLIVR